MRSAWRQVQYLGAHKLALHRGMVPAFDLSGPGAAGARLLAQYTHAVGRARTQAMREGRAG